MIAQAASFERVLRFSPRAEGEDMSAQAVPIIPSTEATSIDIVSPNHLDVLDKKPGLAETLGRPFNLRSFFERAKEIGSRRIDNSLEQRKRPKLGRVAARLALSTVAAVAMPSVAQAADLYAKTKDRAESLCDAPGSAGGRWTCAKGQRGINRKEWPCADPTTNDNPCYFTHYPYTARSSIYVWRYQQESNDGQVLRECNRFIRITDSGRIDRQYDKRRNSRSCKNILFKDNYNTPRTSSIRAFSQNSFVIQNVPFLISASTQFRTEAVPA